MFKIDKWKVSHLMKEIIVIHHITVPESHIFRQVVKYRKIK